MSSGYVGPIRRVDTAKSHYYVDANGSRVPGVTTLLDGGLPKKALINWAAKATAEWAMDHWDELVAMTPSKRLAALMGARYAEKDAAANRGTEVHDLAEKLARGESVNVPDSISGHVESCVQFLNDWEPEVRLLEATVFSAKHGYCGTLDAIFYIPQLDQTILCDWKTNKSGIFGETALQLAGYRYADVIYVDGVEQPMPEVDACYAIHIRADGYSFIPVTAGPLQHRQLLYAREIRAFDEMSRDLIGAPIEPPNRVHRRRLEIAS